MTEGARALSHGTNAAHAREAGEKGFNGRSLGGCVVVFHVSHYTILSTRCKPKLERIEDRKCLWDKGLGGIGAFIPANRGRKYIMVGIIRI